MNWAGNPDKAVSKNQMGQVLGPRQSFEKWAHLRVNKSLPWSAMDLDTIAKFHARLVDLVFEDSKYINQQNEIRIAQLERLSSLGQLAAGISHDFNNVLLGIQGAARMIAGGEDYHKTTTALEAIKLFCQRGTSLVKGLLKHVRTDQKDFKPSDAKLILKELTMFVQTMYDRQFSFEITDLTSDDPQMFNGNANEILQSLLNLVNNAKDALIKNSGSINITLQDDAKSDSIMFLIKDDGKGIAPENLSRIFDPFFSTKELERGTGLGLANVREIIHHHGGELLVSSELGKGSTFSIILPKFKNKGVNLLDPALAQIREQSNIEKCRHLQVLYVEDEEMIRETYTEILSELFGSVVPTANGIEALEKISSSKFDLVISDLRMPKTDGIALYRRLRETDETTAFLLATGEAITRKGILGPIQDSFFDVIGKPFNDEELLSICAHLVELKRVAS